MRKLLKIIGGSAVGGGAAALAMRALTNATRVEPFEVETTRVSIPLRGLHSRFDGFTIAHISDTHLGRWMTRERMLAIVDPINDLQPDLIAITGDFVSGFRSSPLPELTESLKPLRANEQVVAVLGNHDHRRGASRVGEAVQAAGIELLVNHHIALRRGDAALYIAGVDDIWVNQQNLGLALDGIPPDSAVVLLAHEPDYADEPAASRRVGLQLSGHSHGGQVRIPGWGAPVLPWLGQKYDMGLYWLDGMALYVNRGLGMIPPYVRFNCHPEITFITLIS